MIPRRLVDRELAHPALTELDVVDTLHERKAGMAELADGFIALPGGLGTLEELAEVAVVGAARPAREADRAARPGRLLGRAAGVAGPRGGGGVHLARRIGRSSPSMPTCRRCSSGSTRWVAARPPAGRPRRRPRSRRSAVALRGASSASASAVGFGVGQGSGSTPGAVNSAGGHRPDRGESGSCDVAVAGAVGWTSGNLMTARTIEPLPDLVDDRGEVRQASTGMSVRTVSPTASSSVGQLARARSPPPSTRSRSATRISCWRAARVKSLSPGALRTRA